MKVFILLLASASVVFGIVHEVHLISQPLSLHGTDVSEDFKGEPIQARVVSFPSVTVGAMPEALISAVSASHRLPGPESYKVPEANLLMLCHIELESEMTKKGFLCTLDLSKLKMPEEIDFSAHTVLVLSIKAIKETLQRYYHSSKVNEKIMIKIVGTTEKNSSLKDLSTTFMAGN